MLGSKLPALLSARPIRTMERKTAMRGLMLAGIVCGAALTGSAQTGSKLPPNLPTSTSNASTNSGPTAPHADTAQRHRARVIYENGLLQVRADNSSLNQILREISQETGMKIIGGVADQRIFGNYGPAPAVTVLQ